MDAEEDSINPNSSAHAFFQPAISPFALSSPHSIENALILHNAEPNPLSSSHLMLENPIQSSNQQQQQQFHQESNNNFTSLAASAAVAETFPVGGNIPLTQGHTIRNSLTLYQNTTNNHNHSSQQPQKSLSQIQLLQSQQQQERTMKKESKKKQGNFFTQMLSNNMISQSAIKERKSQKNSMKAFLAQEQNYLKSVFGDDLFKPNHYQSTQLQSQPPESTAPQTKTEIQTILPQKNSGEKKSNLKTHSNSNVPTYLIDENPLSQITINASHNNNNYHHQLHHNQQSSSHNNLSVRLNLLSQYNSQKSRNEKPRVFTFNQTALSNNSSSNNGGNGGGGGGGGGSELEFRDRKKSSSDKKHGAATTTHSNEAIGQSKRFQHGVKSKVSQFLENLKVKSPLKNASMLNDYRLRVIGDLAFSSLRNCYVKVLQKQSTSLKQLAMNNNMNMMMNNQNNLRNIHLRSDLSGAQYPLILSQQQQQQLLQSNQSKSSIVTKSKKARYSILSKCERCLAKLPVLDPSSIAKQVWDVFRLIYIIAVVVFMPIDNFILSYTLATSLITESRQEIFWVLLLIALVDICTHFLIGIFRHGDVIRSHKAIATAYLRGQFGIDILSTLPILFRIIGLNTPFLQLLVFLKLFQIAKIFDQQYEYQITRFNKGHIVSIAKVVIIDVFILHFITSLFILIGFAESNEGWIYSLTLQQAEWLLIYTRTFYVMLQLHLTVGTQMIEPVSKIEFWFLGIAQVVMICLVIRTAKKLQRIVRDVKLSNKKAEQEMFWVNVYLRSKDIDQRLKIKVVKYLQFQLNQEDQLPLQHEQRILAQLSPDLRDQILVEMNLAYVQRSKLLSSFSLASQEKLCVQLEVITFSENERVFEEGDFSMNPYYYYLKEGSVDFFVESFKGTQQILKLHHLSKGSWFGELSFLTLKERLVGVVTSEKCEMICLQREVFENTLRTNEEDFSEFKLLESQLKLNEATIQFQNCWSCDNQSHTIKHCPLIHFVPDVEKIILKDKFSYPQIRNAKHSRKERKLNSLNEHRLVSQMQRRFKANNPQIVQKYQYQTVAAVDTMIRLNTTDENNSNNNNNNVNSNKNILLSSNQYLSNNLNLNEINLYEQQQQQQLPPSHTHRRRATLVHNSNFSSVPAAAAAAAAASPLSAQDEFQQKFIKLINHSASSSLPPMNSKPLREQQMQQQQQQHQQHYSNNENNIKNHNFYSAQALETNSQHNSNQVVQQARSFHFELERRNSGSTLPVSKSEVASIKSLLQRLSSKPPTPPSNNNGNGNPVSVAFPGGSNNLTQQQQNQQQQQQQQRISPTSSVSRDPNFKPMFSMESLSDNQQKPLFNSNGSLHIMPYPISPILPAQKAPLHFNNQISVAQKSNPPPLHQVSIQLDVPELSSPPRIRQQQGVSPPKRDSSSKHHFTLMPAVVDFQRSQFAAGGGGGGGGSGGGGGGGGPISPSFNVPYSFGNVHGLGSPRGNQTGGAAGLAGSFSGCEQNGMTNSVQNRMGMMGQSMVGSQQFQQQQVLKTFSSDRYANKVAAVQSQQLSELKLFTLDSRDIDTEVFRTRDGIHSPTCFFGPAIVALTNHSHDNEIEKSSVTSQVSSKKVPYKKQSHQFNSSNNGQGMYSVFNRKILMQQENKRSLIRRLN